jgi:hypothetical protein
MNKIERKEWLTKGMQTTQAALLAAAAAVNVANATKEQDATRRETVAAAVAAAGAPLGAGELICPVLDSVREYLYTDATDTASKKTAANKLTAARRLAERAIVAAFPDANHVVKLRRENGEGKTFRAALAPEKVDPAIRLARQVAREFGQDENTVMAVFTAWDYSDHDKKATGAAAAAAAAAAAKETQRQVLKDVIDGFNTVVQTVADKRGIPAAAAAAILHDVGQVDSGIYGYWLERQAV